MDEPKIGSRWLDKETRRVVVFLGDHGHGPWWRDEETGDKWYCHWLDYYLWGRFESVRN